MAEPRVEALRWAPGAITVEKGWRGRAHSGAMLRPARREKDAEDDREDEKEEEEEGMDRISLRGHACIRASSWCPLSAAELELFPRTSRH